MSAQFDRALLLFGQSRYELAEKELRHNLTADPEDAASHALLALCLVEQQKYDEATKESQFAIHRQPDFPFAHFALAFVMHRRNRLKEALAAIHETIRLDPYDSRWFSRLAAIEYDGKHWNESLNAAEHGLEINAEDIDCTNLRAMALVRLGRKEEAGHTIDVALTRDPDNAVTHANMGWALLESRDPEKALHHFQEALRIDPTSEWARSGIVEAMKARHIIYRWMLGYFLWMMRFSPKVQMALLFGIVIGHSVLANLAEKIPLLRPLKVPIIVCYLLFVLMTWIAQPLFNLILRLNRFGRLALSREQIVESNWLGGYLICSFVLLILGVVLSLGSRELNDFLDVAIHALLVLALSIPLCGTFNSRPGWPKILLVAGTIALTVFAVLAIGLLLIGLLAPRQIIVNQDDLAYDFFMICVSGIIISTWVSTALDFVPHRK